MLKRRRHTYDTVAANIVRWHRADGSFRYCVQLKRYRLSRQGRLRQMYASFETLDEAIEWRDDMVRSEPRPPTGRVRLAAMIRHGEAPGV